MDYKKYMIHNCVWEKNLCMDEDTHMPVFDRAITLKCFKSGKDIFIRDNQNATVIKASSYIVTDVLNVGDKLDGQVIKSVDNIPDFKPTFPIYECLTWNS